jgi:hypothetical protein
MSINLPRVKFANQILPQGKTRKFVLSDFNKKLTSSKPSKMHYLRAAKLQQTKLKNLMLPCENRYVERVKSWSYLNG